ncbi:hypothetical protein LPJ55_000183 [Coemansia sp. RSA 990]|nr:hypothetical protein LPJ55_000183 [Coemansia sp. RSA 990]
MSRKLLKALFVAVVCIGATAVAQAEDSFTSSEPAPVVRNACHEAPCCEHNAHTTVALPPPLTIAYQDPCHPCCANCVTYSDFHVDNEGDDCCKPAAVIKTHHFVKEVNYKCCTGPCGDVSCEPCCTKIYGQEDLAIAMSAASPAAATTTSAAVRSPAATTIAATTIAATMTAATRNPAAIMTVAITSPAARSPAATTASSSTAMTTIAAVATIMTTAAATTTTMTAAATTTMATTAITTSAATTMDAATMKSAATTNAAIMTATAKR